jgi:serine/threonine-protein kinase
MSPEQASGGAIDHRSDIYALGVIMYEMFTGRVPFEADSYMGVLTKHMFMRPDPISRIYEPARQLGALEDVTLKCLEKEPDARYQSMGELVHDIESIVHFDGERLEIMRPSRSVSNRSPGMADHLAPQVRGEHDLSLASSGVPNRVSPLVLAGVVFAAVALAGGVLFALLRGSHKRASGPQQNLTAEVVPASGAAAPTSASSLAEANHSSRGPAPAGAAPPLLKKGSASGLSAPSMAPQSRSDTGARATPHKDPARAGKARDTKRAQPPGSGASDIVNPWAE